MAYGRRIGVIGLGYVGAPIAVAFSRSGADVIGFDIDKDRIAQLQSGRDRTREVSADELVSAKIKFTSDPSDLRPADFFIVTVPTPIDSAHRPDLSALLAASKTVGGQLKRGDIVVFESTVYPGATEEDCVPVLEAASGLKCGVDFSVGYSPERINPGDTSHRFETITKVVSALDARTLDVVADVYGSVVKGGIFRASTIRVAEAAKVIENTQRDLNIALMNELSIIFRSLGIDTMDVLAAAQTKWNFLPFAPGLVGGHCVGVDPYYLTHRAEKAGCYPQVILAGRRVNDEMGKVVAQECARAILRKGGAGEVVTVLGFTFKENVPDIRNSKVVDIVKELEAFGFKPQVTDPLADAGEAMEQYGVTLVPEKALKPAAAVILAVAHASYRQRGWEFIGQLLADGNGLVLDLKACLSRAERPSRVELWRP
jgi:UDP-N-acetyl-D-glucosamine/UDP-N-acetyl-D-galactosamine dehydrogenase